MTATVDDGSVVHSCGALPAAVVPTPLCNKPPLPTTNHWRASYAFTNTTCHARLQGPAVAVGAHASTPCCARHAARAALCRFPVRLTAALLTAPPRLHCFSTTHHHTTTHTTHHAYTHDGPLQVVIPSCVHRLPLAQASLIWRRNLRTLIMLNDSALVERLNAAPRGPGDRSVYEYYPDDSKEMRTWRGGIQGRGCARGGVRTWVWGRGVRGGERRRWPSRYMRGREMGATKGGLAFAWEHVSCRSTA